MAWAGSANKGSGPDALFAQALVQGVSAQTKVAGQVGDITATRLVLAGQIVVLGTRWRRRARWQVKEEVVRQMLGTDGLVVGHGQGHAQDATELAQIARPGVMLEQLQYLAADAGPLLGFTVLFPESLEQRLLVSAYAQRRQLQVQAADG